ncbi:unnamed protein product [Moneuplotes crassus]|uniref:Lipid-binding serum glycoprotein N-terminal domain-containing protein n=1 Tax=Euplotes crassus TaxID=5936 RepID=A0AAD1UK74_EUPCR|nr:unnamed protein product [Moneuplotes crassus]
MNKNLILILLIPLLVVAEEYEAVTVGMNALYAKKVLEQIVIDTPMDINIDEAKHGKLSMSSVSLTIDPPRPEDVEIDFDEKNNSITIEMKNQQFHFDTLVTIQKASFKINGSAKTVGNIDSLKISFGLTTREGEYTNVPVIDVKDIEVKLNEKGWTIGLSTKWLDFMVKPVKGLIKELAIEFVSQIIEEKTEEIIVGQIHEELTRVSGRFMIDDGVLVDMDVLDEIQIKDGFLTLPYYATYYLPEGSDTTDHEAEEGESDCEHEQDSETKLEKKYKNNYKKTKEWLHTVDCIELNQSVKFCFGFADFEEQIENVDEYFTKVEKYFLPTLNSIYNGDAIILEGEE